jgi:hypothetical protein
MWLFKPYTSEHQTCADVFFPLLMLTVWAFVSAIPCFQVKGIVAGVTYGLGSFVLLYVLRNIVFCMLTRPRKEDGYVSTSLVSLGDLYSIGFPGLIWVLVSLKIIACYCWGWKLE